jgi:hypothetical protein
MATTTDNLWRLSDQPDAFASRRMSGWRRSPDDVFFSTMVVVMMGMVFMGFARTYYLAPVYHNHVRSVLIHVHGAVFTTWMLLLATQALPVARRRIAIHRTLGIFGALLAAAMLGLGMAAATDSMARGLTSPGFPFDSLSFYAIPVISITTFATLVAVAMRMRSNGAAHKRLILLATIVLMGPAVARWLVAILARRLSSQLWYST